MTRKLQLDQLLLSNSTALSCIVVQHADDGYSRRGNFGRILFTVSCVFIVCQMAPTFVVQEEWCFSGWSV